MMTERKGGMRCPVDGETLVMSERAGIEIDYCPNCRGAWLDRSELDKIVERSARDSGNGHRQDIRRADARPPMSGSGRNGSDAYEHSQPKRRRSFLQDLFD
jgi:uncharacterized protein